MNDPMNQLMKSVTMTRIRWIEEELLKSPAHKALHGKQIYNWMNEIHAGETPFKSEFIGNVEIVNGDTHLSILPQFVEV